MSYLDIVRSSSSLTDVRGAIEFLLLPLLARVPSPELYIIPDSPPSLSPRPALPPDLGPSSPSHSQLSVQSRAVARTLEHCSEKLPQPLVLAREIDEALRERLMGQLRLSSQLNSVVDYHWHLYQTVSTVEPQLYGPYGTSASLYK